VSAGVFHLLVDGTPRPVRDLLARACEGLGVAYQEVLVRAVDPRAGPLPRGSMLFNPSGSADAARVECQLFAPGVATFHADDLLGPYQTVLDPFGAFACCGLPVPPSVRVVRAEPSELSAIVAQLGGLPVVIKVSGGENGAGVIRADTMLALRSTVQALTLRGGAPLLQAYVPNAVHWRLIVVGSQVVSAYRNVARVDDFRTGPSDDPADFGLVPPAPLVDVARRAAAVLGTEFAGVDLLVREDDTVFLLEANSPCWFPAAQEHEGTPDVAAAMVSWLTHKARRLTG
jgi:hypothetical protein